MTATESRVAKLREELDAMDNDESVSEAEYIEAELRFQEALDDDLSAKLSR